MSARHALPQLQSPELADEIVAVLHDRGPLELEELSAALGEDPDDPEWGADLDSVLDARERIVELADERLADAVALLAGSTLTRRLTATEVAGGHLELDGDLCMLVGVIEDSVPLARGGRARPQIGRDPGRAPSERLVGPPGWLGDARAGDLVGLRLADGLLHVAVRPETVEGGPAARAFEAAAHERLADSEHDPPRAGTADVVWHALAADPATFAGVLPPLSELAAEAGLQLTETMVLPGDADVSEFDPLPDLIADVAARVRDEADDEAVAAIRHLRATTRALERGEDVSATDLAVAAEALHDEGALEGFLSQPALGAAAAARLGAAIAAIGTVRARAAGAYLQSRAAADEDDAVAGERLITESLDADPGYRPALLDAARFAEVRGDAPAALRLLGRAGREDSDDVDRLRAYVMTAGGAKVGRNDPCPCGSGRKYKRCCADRSGGALPQRASWLLEKIHDGVGGRRLEERLAEQLEAAGRLTDWVETGVGHPLVEDVALFDLGLLDDFLERWGPLLPDDERALARAWTGTRRGCYEVRTTRGRDVTLRADDGADLVAHCPGPQPPRGTTLLARLLPDGGGGWLLTAGALVDDRHDPAVTASLDPATDPLTVAEAWAGGRPVLATTEGEPSVACVWEAPLPPGGAARVAEALRGHGLAEDDAGTFVETAEVAGQPRVRGTVTLTDDAVRIDTNAEARLDRLVGYVRDAVGEVEPVVDRRTPSWQAVEDQRRYGVLRPPPEPTAEEQAFVDELLREQEARWLDESVPALGGLTPREAREHPTGQAALEDLLASFDDAAGGFDSDRLRALLDLPARTGRPGRDPAGSADRAAARKEARARRAFAVSRLEGEWQGIDLAFLDPEDDDDLWVLVEAEHDLAESWSAGDPYHEPSAEIGAHYAMHAAVASQLFHDEPPQLWATAQRLLGDGYERHEILHMLASAFAGQLWLDRSEQRGEFDVAGYVARLEALPESWEQERDEATRPRGRRPPAGHG